MSLPRPIKLMMASRRFPPDVRSGTETVFEALYSRARRRHDTRLVVGWTRSRAQVPEEALAVPLRGLGRPAAWAAMSKAIFQEARRFAPDVILSNSIEAPPTGRPTAVIIHDLNFGGGVGGLERRLRERFYLSQARRFQVIIAVSQATARELRALGVPEDRLSVVGNGVDLERFHPAPALSSVPADGPVVLKLIYAARFVPGKGQHHVIDAVARLRADQKARVHLRLVGAGADQAYLDQLRLQAYKQPVTFEVDVPDVAACYRECDAALFPSVMTEGFGFSAVEAMASGLPVIWFDQPAVREATGGLGLPVPMEDVPGFRAAILRLLSEPGLAARLGAEARAFCEARYDWDGVWARYEQILTGLVSAG